MSSESDERTAEHRESLWALVAGPAIWALHFFASYITAAVWCAKLADERGSLSSARAAIFVYTAAALLGLSMLAWRGLRRHRHGDGGRTHAGDSALDRHRFIGFATFLLSVLGAVAVVYAAFAALVIGDCR